MRKITAMQDAFYNRIIFQPWRVIGVSLIVVFAVASFMRFVAPSISYKDMLGEDYPLLKVYEQIQAEYTNDDNLLVLVEAKDGNVFTNEILLGVKNLTTELWKTPYSVRVDSVTNFQNTEADGDDLKVGDLVSEPGSLSPTELSRIKAIALAEPLLVNRVVSQDGQVLAINVSFAFPNLSMDEKLGADEYVQKLVKNSKVNIQESMVM